MAYVALNNAYSTLATSLTSDATNVTVQTGHGVRFAVGSDYTYATLEDASGNVEIVKVTAQSGDTLTVVRGQDGTTARVWSEGSLIECRPCRAAVDAIMSGAIGVSSFNGLTGNVTGVSSVNGLTGDLTGFVTETGTQTLTNKTLTSPTINNGKASGLTLNDGYTEEIFAVTGTTPALSPTNGSIQTWTLSGASTPTAGTWADGQSITLMIDDGTANTINWSSLGVVWKTNGGSAPTLLTTGLTVIQLWKVGNVIYGARVGDA